MTPAVGSWQVAYSCRLDMMNASWCLDGWQVPGCRSTRALTRPLSFSRLLRLFYLHSYRRAIVGADRVTLFLRPGHPDGDSRQVGSCWDELASLRDLSVPASCRVAELIDARNEMAH